MALELGELFDEELELGLVDDVYDGDFDTIEVVVTDCDFDADTVVVHVSDELPVELGDTIEVIVADQDDHGDCVVVTVAEV